MVRALSRGEKKGKRNLEGRKGGREGSEKWEEEEGIRAFLVQSHFRLPPYTLDRGSLANFKYFFLSLPPLKRLLAGSTVAPAFKGGMAGSRQIFPPITTVPRSSCSQCFSLHNCSAEAGFPFHSYGFDCTRYDVLRNVLGARSANIGVWLRTCYAS